MLLNLYRVEDANPEKMIISSFLQFQNDVGIPDYTAKIEAQQARIDVIEVEDEEAIADYYHLKTTAAALHAKLGAVANKPSNCLAFLQPGRLVRVTDGEDEWGWGVVVNFSKVKSAKGIAVPDAKAEDYTVDCLLRAAADSEAAGSGAPRPAEPASAGEMLVIPVHLNAVTAFSSIRVFLPKDLRSKEARGATGRSLQVVLARDDFADGIPELDMVADMKIKSKHVEVMLEKVATLRTKMAANRMHTSESLQQAYAGYASKMAIKAEIKELKREMKTSNDMILKVRAPPNIRLCVPAHIYEYIHGNLNPRHR
jgi:ATP-dependent RNA helicase DOB1